MCNNVENPEDNPLYFEAADEAHVRREKNKANELKKTQWWKNKKGQGRCYYCGRSFAPKELTMDHLVPIIRGGYTARQNVVPCCHECNAKKQYKLPVEWDEYLEGRIGKD